MPKKETTTEQPEHDRIQSITNETFKLQKENSQMKDKIVKLEIQLEKCKLATEKAKIETAREQLKHEKQIATFEKNILEFQAAEETRKKQWSDIFESVQGSSTPLVSED